MELQNTLIAGCIGFVAMLAFIIISVAIWCMWEKRKNTDKNESKKENTVSETSAKTEGGAVQSLLILGIAGVMSFMVFGMIAEAGNNYRALGYLEKTQGGTFTILDVENKKEPKLSGYGDNNKINVIQELNGKTSLYTVTFENGAEPTIQEYTG